jgi:N-methylhydantoinase A
MRYRGQAHELTVEMTGAAAARSGAADLRSRFERAHAGRYGYADPDGEIELVNIRVAASSPRDTAGPAVGTTGTARARRASRRARFGGEWLEATVITGDLGAGEQVEGPAICELAEATVVVPPGWSGSTDDAGTLALERRG